jgi:hypothetical protein
MTDFERSLEKCLGYMLLIFPPNVDLGGRISVKQMVEGYAGLLGDIPTEKLASAFLLCATTLRHFPYPVDIFEAVEALENTQPEPPK